MQFSKSPIALAVLALTGALPLAAEAAPSVAFKTPTSGKTISGNIYQSTAACEAVGTNIKKVVFFLDSTQLNTELTAPWTCNLDTRKFANGAHALKALAYDSAGVSRSASLSVNIQNGTTTTPPPPPPPTSGAAPTVAFKAPANGATVSGALSGGTCEALVASSGTMKQVQFFMDSTLLNTEGGAPWNCALDTKKFADGAHALKAVATDSSGRTGTSQISVNVKNSTTTPPPGGTTLPAPGSSTTPNLWFKSPVNGATVSGALQLATCYVAGNGVNKVAFSIDSTPLNTDTNVADGMSCALDTTKFANGTHQLIALGTSATGATYKEVISINVQNSGGSTPPGNGGSTPPDSGGGTPGTGTPGTGSSLPSTNTKAIATFHSLGLYWKPGTNPGAAGCTIRYRKMSESSWKDGLAMWYDARDGECRGSLVQLAPDTSYVVEMGLPGKTPSAGLTAKTWSENFPIAKTVYVNSGSSTLNITEGGSAGGYVLYTAAPGTTVTLDAKKAADYNITVSAPFVIVRGLTLKGAKVDAIRLNPGTKDVVIENNDISEWGTYNYTNPEGWKIGVNMHSGIRAMCGTTQFLERSIIQRNKIHHPSYGSNSWSDGHPAGPNAVLFSNCGGNHVFRYNEVYSEAGRYFMDGYGGEDNFSAAGMPNADSDIYGNIIRHTWDDAIEAEGGNRNVRIWGNYFDETTTGVATTATHYGPVYLFRNVYNRSRQLARRTLDNDDRNTMFKSGNSASFGNGRRFIFHNTTLQAPPPAGSQYPLGAGGGINGAGSTSPLTNTVSRNNILQTWKSWWPSIDQKPGGFGNDLDYDLFNGSITAYAGAEPHGILGTPIYAGGNGWSSEANGMYQLAPNSPGFDKGVPLPNFNDGFSGAAPDMGAHEAGAPAMKFGVGQ